jgi:hypothetical protein
LHLSPPKLITFPEPLYINLVWPLDEVVNLYMDKLQQRNEASEQKGSEQCLTVPMCKSTILRRPF